MYILLIILKHSESSIAARKLLVQPLCNVDEDVEPEDNDLQKAMQMFSREAELELRIQ